MKYWVLCLGLVVASCGGAPQRQERYVQGSNLWLSTLTTSQRVAYYTDYCAGTGSEIGSPEFRDCVYERDQNYQLGLIRADFKNTTLN